MQLDSIQKYRATFLNCLKNETRPVFAKKTVEIASFGALVAHLISKVRQEYGIPTSL